MQARTATAAATATVRCGEPGEPRLTSRALIVGGGTGGLCCSVALRRAGIDAEIIEVKRDWTVLGSGVTMMGATLRALDELGLGEECVARGAGGDNLRLYTHQGTPIEDVPVARVSPHLPAVAGIMRPALHNMLVEAAAAEDTPVRLGLTVNALESDVSHVHVRFSDGSEGDYDFVVAADGIHSKVRELILPRVGQPPSAGQMTWRLVVRRRNDLPQMSMFYGPRNKAGFNAVSATHAYMFVADNEVHVERPPREEWAHRLRELLVDFDGPVGEVRDSIEDDAPIDCREVQTMLVGLPWHSGRIVLIGDAAHAPTPHLAMGAGLAVEDAVVLADEITTRASVEEAFEAYAERRFARCRMVVENALQLARWEREPDHPGADPGGLTSESWAALAQPI